MEKIINTSDLIDALKILLWDRSKSREEMIELAIGLIEEAGEEVVRCRDCTDNGSCFAQDVFSLMGVQDGYCYAGARRGSDG